MKSDRNNVLLIVAVIGIALNLRPALAALGPVLDIIQASLAMSYTQASLLTTIPVFLMGAGSLCVNQYPGQINARTAVAAATALILIACVARYFTQSAMGLLTTAAVVGIGIACVQALLPGFIKSKFGLASGNVLAMYSTGIMGGAAFAAAASAGLVGSYGLSAGLAVWALPALFALVFWMKATRPQHAKVANTTASSTSSERYSFYTNTRALALMLFFGIGTGAYTLVLAWMPPFYTSLGWTASQAGYLLAGITLAEVTSGIVVSLFVHRFPDRRWPLLGVLLMLLISLTGLVVAPDSLAIPICLLLGLSIGALFPLSLILTADHIHNPAGAGRLMAFVQGGGYMIASLMPLLAGMIRDHFASLTHAWLVMAAGVVVLLGMSLRFSPASYVRIRR